MPDLIAAERQTYETAWDLPAYRVHAPGEHYLPLFLDMAKPAPGATVLDAGCGSGKGSLALKNAGFAVWGTDLTDAGLDPAIREQVMFLPACLWDDLRVELGVVGGWEWVYCTDVLEHIPPTFTMLVVARLLEVARCGVFLTIATQPDQFGYWVGTQLHQTMQSFTAWRDQLATLGHVVECRDLLVAGVFLVAPR